MLSGEELDNLYQKLAELSESVDNSPFDPTLKLQSGIDVDYNETEIESEIKSKFLTPSNQISWNLLNELNEVPKLSESQAEDIRFSLIEKPSIIGRTAFRSKRTGIKGEIVDHVEGLSAEILDLLSNKNSAFSTSRKYTGNARLNVRGGTAGVPFYPGGLNDDNESDSKNIKTGNTISKNLHKDDYGLFDIPPGFSRGLIFDSSLVDISDVNIDDSVNNSSDDIKKEGNQENQDDGVIEIINDGGDDDDYDDNDDDGNADADADAIQQNSNNNDIENEITHFIPSDSIIRPSKNYNSLENQIKRKTNWAHEVDLNHRIENFDELIPNPARTWPFELDVFQQEAVYHLEQGDSVFVAAHTSAGKTVVAEYAIAMAHNNMTKAIYTSPIKALSNQKFRDFKHTFKEIDVGIITGDVQINPEANCLIMTTEILRSMLYRGSDVIRDVEFVIFDEVHYVNDVDRGVVWEEVIIMLPEHIKIILLSATVPNTYEFASWVGRTKQKDIYVISTPKRPVPLEIFVFAKDRPFKVIDSNRNFLDSGYDAQAAKFESKVKKIEDNNNNTSSRGGARGGARGGSRGGSRGVTRGNGNRGGARGGRLNNGTKFTKRDAPTSKSWTTLVTYLRNENLLPAVIFVFSKRRCEEYAESLSGFNFSTAKESSEIHMFIDKAVSRLKKEDRELPQILRMREMLKRGIAVHHGGLLPIIKEVVEILFSKSLIKILFATETFAMGLNLPTRTVVFSSLRKHDGTGFRDLLPGEFTQMSGRAGRRGLDKIGTVMIMAYQQQSDKNTLNRVCLGMPTKLSSQFRLTYLMILNLLRIEALKVEDMIKRSFSENAGQSLLPQQQLEIIKYEEHLKTIDIKNIETNDLKLLEKTCSLMTNLKKANQIIFGNVTKAKKILKTGRLIVFEDKNKILQIGVLDGSFVNNSVEVILCPVNEKNRNETSNLVFDPIFGKLYNKKFFTHWNSIQYSKLYREKVPFSDIQLITDEFIKFDKLGVKRCVKKEIHSFTKELQQKVSQRNGWNIVDYRVFTSENTIESVLDKQNIITELSNILKDSKIIELIEQDNNYSKVYEKMQTENKMEEIKKSLSDENLELLPEYNKRLEVLKELKYVDPTQLTITLKGRVACEISSGWELIMTELVFDNFLGNFSAEEIVALLSCFVYDGKKGDDESFTKLATPRLEKGKDAICDIVKKIMEISTEKAIQITAEEENFLEVDRFALVNTVYEWARGRSFKEIMENSNDADESEGTIVRVITFLDEICNQVRNASIITGDSELHSKMITAQEKIKRDIVFCASLYL